MIITPFPVVELAKLVLGYLAEEQLMTAYDEFLQASPLLDPYRNEYDRIFMTSLRKVMAEYRAAMIYVQASKPCMLRRILMVNCKNIMEVVKFLVENVDVNKLKKFEIKVKSGSLNKSNEKNTCEVCISLNQKNCDCLGLHVEQPPDDPVPNDPMRSTEATALENLPGLSKDNIPNTNRKKSVRAMEEDCLLPSCNEHNELRMRQRTQIPNNNIRPDVPTTSVAANSVNTSIKTMNVLEAQKIKELNEILNLVCKKDSSMSSSGAKNDQHTPHANCFQGYCSGVGTSNVNVQAMNTPVYTTVTLPVAQSSISSGRSNVIDLTKSNSQSYRYPYVLVPKPADPKITILSDIRMENSNNSYCNTPPVLKNVTSTSMGHTQTIYINGTPAYKDKSNIGIKYNFTKDEIMAMPTIIVVPVSAPGQAAGISQPLTTIPEKVLQTTNVGPTKSLEPLTIDVTSDNPIIIKNSEIANLSEVALKKKERDSHTKEDNTNKTTSSVGLVTTLESSKTGAVNLTGLVTTIEACNQTEVKTLDAYNIESNTLKLSSSVVSTEEIKRVCSLPKENSNDNGSKVSTPQVLPVIRKSSSTPRRTSHVRVLDFATPRRILSDTIEEHNPTENYETNTETVISDGLKESTETNASHISTPETTSSIDKVESIASQDGSKENKCNNNTISVKKSSWDAELRALVAGNQTNNTVSSSRTKTRHKTSKKRKSVEVSAKKITEEKSKSKKKTSKLTKKRLQTDEIAEIHVNIIEDPPVPLTIKPTIKIVSSNERATSSIQDNENDIDKPEPTVVNIDDKPDTPEMDRISMQSAMGVKLNISDLLETPFKQAIYDIQMETPRFLGPELLTSDTPLSDIKILNIPTPRFLDSPNLASKQTQATPSSYSSRPTDYSSGGSYYKPDDLDYIPSPEKIKCIITPPTFSENYKPPKNQQKDSSLNKDSHSKEKGKKNKPGRPVRRCTRNVSYYKSPVSKKLNEQEKNNELETSSSSDNLLIDVKLNTQEYIKVHAKVGEVSEDILSIENKTESVTKASAARKGRKPTKDALKTVLKIQPKKASPKKRVSKDRCSESLPTKQSKRRTSNKAKKCVPPVVTPAPTKSRRKSSTPRKLHCTKSFNSESITDNTEEKTKRNLTPSSVFSGAQDSDIEQLPLRWSDDGSQESKTHEVNDSDDINKIQDYIQRELNKPVENYKLDSPRKKTTFDKETAKIIERDLLDGVQCTEKDAQLLHLQSNENDKAENIKHSDQLSTRSAVNTESTSDLDDEEGVIEFSTYECNEESGNFINFEYDKSTVTTSKQSLHKLKDKYSMEVCIDDGVVIRLRATQFIPLFELDNCEYNPIETEMAVSSISNFDKLYTPFKDSIKAQCYEIFDSTLTSLDTPLKINRSSSPRRNEKDSTITEIILEIEPVIDDKIETKNVEEKKENKSKRKRFQSGSVSNESENKRAKTDAQFLLNSTNIQNMDIESVLSKLHGP